MKKSACSFSFFQNGEIDSKISDGVLFLCLIQECSFIIISIQIGQISMKMMCNNSHLFISTHWKIERTGLRKKNQHVVQIT